MLSRQSTAPDIMERGQRLDKLAKSRASRQVRSVVSAPRRAYSYSTCILHKRGPRRWPSSSVQHRY